MRSEWNDQSKDLKEKRKDKNSAMKNVDKQTTDSVLRIMVKKFRNCMLEAHEKLDSIIKEKWIGNANHYREYLVQMITGSDALTEEQSKQLSTVILNYEPLSFNDEEENLFIKAKFLRGRFFGLNMIGSERLNTRKLTTFFNNRLSKEILEMSLAINDSRFESFSEWQDALQDLVEDNIADFNPELREITELIKYDKQREIDLKRDQKTIADSLKAVKEMMDWKTIDE